MLAPIEMSVPAADGLVLKGTLTYPGRDELLTFLRRVLGVA